METGIRTGLKKIVPDQLWPLCRFVDRYLINALYMYFAAKRYLAGRRMRSCQQWKQSIPVFPSAIDLGAAQGAELTARLDAAGMRYKSGRHSVYLDDPADIARINPDILTRYPEPAALKLIRSREMSPDSTPYYTSHLLAPASTWFSMVAVGSMREKAVISNLLHEEGLAPRVYDVIRLESGDGGWQYGFLVQPVQGEVVTGEEGTRFINRFKAGMEQMGMETVSIREHCDLRPPEFRHNIVADTSGTYYVDIQNFVMFSSGYGKNLLREMKQHGRAVSLPEEKDRSSAQPPEDLAVFLARSKVVPARSSVLDCGMDDETLSAYFLGAGAPWAVLLRQADSVSVVRRYLYYHGFTRFDVVALENERAGRKDRVFLQQHDLALVPATQGEGIQPGADSLPVSCYLVVGHAGQTVAQLNALVQEWSRAGEFVDAGLVHWPGSLPRAVVLCRKGM
jgi:hypothetical protein